MGKGDPDGQHQVRMMPPECCIRHILRAQSDDNDAGIKRPPHCCMRPRPGRLFHEEQTKARTGGALRC
jgi:hypothetical protein